MKRYRIYEGIWSGETYITLSDDSLQNATSRAARLIILDSYLADVPPGEDGQPICFDVITAALSEFDEFSFFIEDLDDNYLFEATVEKCVISGYKIKYEPVTRNEPEINK